MTVVDVTEGIAVGAESLSTPNTRLDRPFVDEIMNGSQDAADCMQPMGQTSENVARDFDISRQTQVRLNHLDETDLQPLQLTTLTRTNTQSSPTIAPKPRRKPAGSLTKLYPSAPPNPANPLPSPRTRSATARPTSASPSSSRPSLSSASAVPRATAVRSRTAPPRYC